MTPFFGKARIVDNPGFDRPVAFQLRQQTSLREWAYARAYQHSRQRKDELPTWLHRYNWHSPHAGIDGKTPISRLSLTWNNVLRLHISIPHKG
jgi:hypothetical protein